MSPRRHLPHAAPLALLFLSACCTTPPHAAPAPAASAPAAPLPRASTGATNAILASTPALRVPAYLPAGARDIIAQRMGDHGADMKALLWGVLFFDDGVIRRVAADMGTREQVGATNDLEGILPDEFFVLEAQLGAQAKAMVRLASAPEPNAMVLARAYGALTETCVACHGVYLHGTSAFARAALSLPTR